MNLSNQDLQMGQAMFESSTTAKHPLGQRGYLPDGRGYRYVKAGVAALAAARVVQSPAIVPGNLALALNTTSAFSAGTTALTLTAASAAAAGLYNDGYAVISTGAGQGFLYTVNNSPLVSTGAVGVFNLYGPEDALQVAITVTSKVGLIQNKYSGVIVAPITTATGIVVGVSTYVINANEFGWIQTRGPCAVLIEGTPALGAPVYGIAISSAGAVAAVTAAALLTNQPVGYMMQIGVANEQNAVDLRID